MSVVMHLHAPSKIKSNFPSFLLEEVLRKEIYVDLVNPWQSSEAVMNQEVPFAFQELNIFQVLNSLRQNKV